MYKSRKNEIPPNKLNLIYSSYECKKHFSFKEPLRIQAKDTLVRQIDARKASVS